EEERNDFRTFIRVITICGIALAIALGWFPRYLAYAALVIASLVLFFKALEALAQLFMKAIGRLTKFMPLWLRLTAGLLLRFASPAALADCNAPGRCQSRCGIQDVARERCRMERANPILDSSCCYDDSPIRIAYKRAFVAYFSRTLRLDSFCDKRRSGIRAYGSPELTLRDIWFGGR